MTIKYVSLFSGAGGLDEGLHRAGFTPLFCCEIDKHARESLANWAIARNISPKIWDDINTLDPANLLSQIRMKKGELPLLVGGPPCQSFSLIGKRRSLEDARGLLFYKMLEFADVLRPQVVLIEQVKGLRSAKGADGSAGGALRFMLGELQALGYNVEWQILRASNYGIPQHRDRLFIVATNCGKSSFPQQTHFSIAEVEKGSLFNDLKPHVTLADVILDLPPPVRKGEIEEIPGHVDVTPQRDMERINGVPQGECLAKQLHLPESQRMRLNPSKDTTKFRRLAFELPSLTLRCGEAFYHPIENRYLTPREYMRIHTFSDDQTLAGPIRARTGTVKNLDQHRQVTNAVPPEMGKVLAIEIRDQLLAASKKCDLKLYKSYRLSPQHTT